MIEAFNTRYLLPTKELRCLSLLMAIYENPANSQKAIGEATYLSSSMVNNYMKYFTDEGLVTISGNTNRTKSYHVTEAGYEILTSSLLDYSAEIVQLYSSVKKEIVHILTGFYEEGIRNIVLYGAAETAEIVYASARDTRLTVSGIIDNDETKYGKPFNDLTIKSPDEIAAIDFDAIIIASFGKQEEIYQFIKEFTGGRVLIKRLSDL